MGNRIQIDEKLDKLRENPYIQLLIAMVADPTTGVTEHPHNRFNLWLTGGIFKEEDEDEGIDYMQINYLFELHETKTIYKDGLIIENLEEDTLNESAFRFIKYVLGNLIIK